ncbi:MAG: hypothetical protein ABIR39_05765 [Nocardioides sp.]|uniref:hypothetical protein n=1 Tax=Nocardioides sp. TaxID=35761 RepID=UPI00326732B6
MATEHEAPPRKIVLPDLSRPGIVVPVSRDPNGVLGPTKRQASQAAYRRTSWGLYVPRSVDGMLVEQRIVEAGAALPSHGGVTGWAGLRWQGGKWFGGTAPSGDTHDVWLATNCADVRPQSGFRVSAERLDPRDLTVCDGLPVTTSVRSVVFEMRYATNLRAAVEALDMACYSDLVSLAEVAAYLEDHPGWTGIGQAREALKLGREDSWSPQETQMGLVWQLDAELPRCRFNVPIFDLAGNHLATVDQLDQETGLALEYNGLVHVLGEQRRRDRDREQVLRGVGLQILTLLEGDLPARGLTASRMRDARNQAADSAALDRRWTATPPPWWRDTSTVESRRALSTYDNERLLAHRRLAG